MSIPTQAQLEKEKKDTEERIRKLKEAYDIFVTEWSTIQKEERKVLSELKRHIDNTKIHSVLSTIHSIED